LPTLCHGPPPVGFSAPSALPARGIHFPARCLPPAPACGSHRRSGPGRPTSARALVVPPYLVAGFQSRSGPPSPFLTTLTVSASSDPVECFIHSRPWGSAPGSPLHPPVGRSEDQPSRCSPVCCVPKCVPHERGGRVIAQEAPGRRRTGQMPKHPPESRRHRSHSRRSWSGSGSPSCSWAFSVSCGHRGVRSSGSRSRMPAAEATLTRATASANRRGVPARSHDGVASPARTDRGPGMSQTTAGLAGQRVRTCALPKDRVASNPPALPAVPPLDGPAVRDSPARLRRVAAVPEGAVASRRCCWRRGLELPFVFTLG
jgi:hypothetical protein